MNRWKIRRSTVDIILLIISFYEITGIPHFLFLLLKYVIILRLIILYHKECKKKKMIVIPVLLYGGITFISTMINQTLFNKSVASFVYILHILAIYMTISSFIKKRGIKELVFCLIKILLSIIAVTDVPMLFLNYDFSNPSTSYLIGNKFAVSYLHCFVAALIFLLGDEKNKTLKYSKKRFGDKIDQFIFLVFSIIICIRVNCTTGVLICLLMGVMIYFPFPMKTKIFISNPIFMILLTFIINILIFGSFSLLTNPYVANFVSKTLGKSGTWIGRIHIYAIIMDVIKVHPWIGYGYFSNIIDDIIGFGNAQNGVLKIIIDSGIIGLSGYILLVRNSLKNYALSSRKLWPLIVFVYCMILASIAEINLTDYLFFLCASIIFCTTTCEDKSRDLKMEKLEENWE